MKSARPRSEFQQLWDLLPHPTGSVVRLFARSGDHRDGDFARTTKEIKRFAETYVERNVYVAPNPTCSTRGTRHTAKEVTHWSFFLIDVDPVHEKLCNPSRSMERALMFLGAWTGFDFKKTPPIIIDSGRGIQAWVRLDDWELVDKVADDNKTPGVIERSLARRVNGHWLKKLNEYVGIDDGCRIDTATSDLPRLMRCPGTMNQKTGKRARFVVPSAAVFTGLAKTLYEQTPSSVFWEPEAPQGLSEGARWQEAYPHLTMMAQKYLTQGQSEPGRHKVMWHTAKKLREVGVSRKEAQRALRWANGLLGKEEALPDEEVTHALDTAYNG